MLIIRGSCRSILILWFLEVESWHLGEVNIVGIDDRLSGWLNKFLRRWSTGAFVITLSCTLRLFFSNCRVFIYGHYDFLSLGHDIVAVIVCLTVIDHSRKNIASIA